MNHPNEAAQTPNPVQHPPELTDETWRSEHLQEPPKALSMGCLMSFAAMVVGGGILLLSLDFQPAYPATRSSRLQWQERQAEIQKALAEQREYLAQHEPDTELPSE